MIGLSLFNGAGGAMMALDTLGVKVDKMYISEIDKYANQASMLLFPEQIQLGDITKWTEWEYKRKIDLATVDIIFAGFPCQAWSMAGKQGGDTDPRGALVHDLLELYGYIKLQNPDVQFMFENVAMKKQFMDFINELFGVEPVVINAALVTAQNRKRNYWASWEISQPDDLGITWGDVREWNVDPVFYYSKAAFNWLSNHSRRKGKDLTLYSTNGKMQMVEASHFKNYSSQRFFGVLDHEGVRYVTPRECMRLQGWPEWVIDKLLSSGISNTQLYKMVGNGWPNPVIVHNLKCLFNTEKGKKLL